MTPRFSPGALRVGLSALLADRPPANAAGLQLGDRRKKGAGVATFAVG